MPSGNPGQPRYNRRGPRKPRPPRPNRQRRQPIPVAQRWWEERVRSQAAPLDQLEQRVAELIAAEHSVREIAQILRKHPSDVLKLDLSIRAKLRAGSRADVARLIPTDEQPADRLPLRRG